ncbi:MAG: type 4 pilus major pilin [Alphaproteobacteria bacterium]|nr:type 4 pilus major pilin [Alphaproteobacteria bacterium]
MQTQNESGRTMIETMAVLVVLTVMMLGVISGLGFMFTSWRLYTIHAEVEEIAQGVLDLTSWDRDFAKANMGVICANDILPRACKKTGAWDHPWGGEIRVFPAGDNSSFEIQLTQLPRDVCIELKRRSDWRFVGAPNGACGTNQANNTLTFAPVGI